MNADENNPGLIGALMTGIASLATVVWWFVRRTVKRNEQLEEAKDERLKAKDARIAELAKEKDAAHKRIEELLERLRRKDG